MYVSRPAAAGALKKWDGGCTPRGTKVWGEVSPAVLTVWVRDITPEIFLKK